MWVDVYLDKYTSLQMWSFNSRVDCCTENTGVGECDKRIYLSYIRVL